MWYPPRECAGFYQGKLISYKNIEYGVLKYVQILSNGYFSKGLDTVEEIGVVYNPTFNENGVKIAQPSWVYNVKSCLNRFESFKGITNVSELKLFLND